MRYIAKLAKVVSIISDWTLASLPIVYICKLQMTLKLKAGICILMGMGVM